MSEYTPITVPMGISNDNEAVPVRIGLSYAAGEYETYSGPYNVTPGANNQTLATRGKVMQSDVTVGKIPNNYGLVTWNGSIITVS